MSATAQTIGWSVTTSRLNKEILHDEKNTWQNMTGTPDEFFESIKAGQATAPVLGLNITDRPEYQAQVGLTMPNPSLGPFRRGRLDESERSNDNIAEIWIEGFDIDGDAPLSVIDASPALKELMWGCYTTSSHRIADKGDRVRLVFVLEHPIVWTTTPRSTAITGGGTSLSELSCLLGSLLSWASRTWQTPVVMTLPASGTATQAHPIQLEGRCLTHLLVKQSRLSTGMSSLGHSYWRLGASKRRTTA